jgi:hypothetical protein
MLQRRTELKRTRLKRKPKRRYRGDGPAAMSAWRAEHESCAACWKHYRTFGVVLSTHHLVGGNRSRPDYLWNVIRLCDRCHDWIHGLKNRVAIGMALKLESERESYDRKAMVEWYARFGTERVPRAAKLPSIVWQWREESGFYRNQRLGLE